MISLVVHGSTRRSQKPSDDMSAEDSQGKKMSDARIVVRSCAVLVIASCLCMAAGFTRRSSRSPNSISARSRRTLCQLISRIIACTSKACLRCVVGCGHRFGYIRDIDIVEPEAEDANSSGCDCRQCTPLSHVEWTTNKSADGYKDWPMRRCATSCTNTLVLVHLPPFQHHLHLTLSTPLASDHQLV
ncbi:hypothetical protein EJ03DRAFT_108280 [Teratosphaeria nubilosa]|uniref:Uncharacterized protein n=1 Tax=Teratosphaeria nubilosa TaxID=161662 RepID=A0A6G1L824_9PEZI|nr:hypothetical protein EJ03DRAFT_108280 [Teratosphaeria nubilosa]